MEYPPGKIRTCNQRYTECRRRRYLHITREWVTPEENRYVCKQAAKTAALTIELAEEIIVSEFYH
jgi:hypothetical protein